ncbi:MAG TPA: DUF2958 domain-containing protein [Elusimicrobiales bacterium]|nr:DUF2958 domain-containing protein [Elusimicrobiales bacterium]
MKLLTKAIENAFVKQGDTSEKSSKDIKVICKFFNPVGSGTWWLFERLDEDVFMAFCLLDDPTFAEIGTVSLREFQELKLPFGLGIERDLSFDIGEKTVQEVMDEVKGI